MSHLISDNGEQKENDSAIFEKKTAPSFSHLTFARTERERVRDEKFL